MTPESKSNGRGDEDLPSAPFGLSLREAADIVELGEAETMAEVAAAAPPDLADRFGLRCERFGSAVALATRGLDAPLLNRVLGLGVREPVTEAHIEAIHALYEGAGVRYLVQVSPALPPTVLATLREGFERRGLTRQDNWTKLLRDAAPPEPARTDLRIALATAADAPAVAEIMSAGFEEPPEMGQILATLVGRPDWRHYLAWDGDRPVAVGILFVHGPIGALEGAATLPAHRGRGAQSALMAQRIADAATLGCRWLITETGEETTEEPNPSYRNMLRAGFRVVYQRPNWVYFPQV